MNISKYLNNSPLSKMLDLPTEYIIHFFQNVSGIAKLSLQTLIATFKYKPNWRGFWEQMFAVGNKSISIVLLTALFTGMVLALQFSIGLARFGLKMYAGSIVGLSITRELGPVLTSLMIAARVGSGITAEIGSMVVTEQVMAIEAMGANPLQKLVVPRVAATIIATPLLAVLGDIVGILGGMIISMMEAGVTGRYYMDQIWQTIEFEDFGHGIAKTFIFGFLISIIACYEGLNTRGGTEGVGMATTRTVVFASISIFISDFFMTKLFIMF
jgi:phospholipid/cholesterol/gamma-HCH transport system permease protein